MKIPLFTSKIKQPLAITMWDFSWLERRWPGAGYEDIGLALDELVDRGYDAVRIDAYPHLLSVDPEREWELLPEWNTQDWGSPVNIKVSVQPHLSDFLRQCRARGIRVALSTWFRQDRDDHRRHIVTARDHGTIWKNTLDLLKADGVLDAVFMVDLCNEWPISCWAPFFQNRGSADGADWASPTSLAWMKEAIDLVREAHPELALTFSTCSRQDQYNKVNASSFDLIEAHLWMANHTEFYYKVGYNYERFSGVGYEKVVQHAEKLYRHNPEYWKKALHAGIQQLADGARSAGKPLVTTECWSIVDYKDWPGLNWEWVKELNALGTEWATETGCWMAVATSNFCGPQFRGMWRDIAWHRRLTKMIKSASLPRY